MTMTNISRRPDTGIVRLTILGGLGLLLLAGVMGGWAATTMISGAVVTNGQISIVGKSKTVQSLDGGVLVDIAVSEGDLVQEGDVLARLDPTLFKTNLDIARTRLSAALALRARLEAEQNTTRELVFDYSNLPVSLSELNLDTTRDETGQRSIFMARAETLRGGRERLAEKLSDISNQMEGVRGQINAVNEQLSYFGKDLENMEALVARGLAKQSQLRELQRAQSALLGELSSRTADLARLGNSRRETELETIQVESGFHEKVVTELRKTNAEIEELVLEIVTRTAQLKRVDIRAPSDGIVHEVQTTTIGGVVAPGATLMAIVPMERDSTFDLQIDTASVDQTHVGQLAEVVLAAFDRQSVPKLNARVSSISPEAVKDPQTGRSFFRATLDISGAELAKLPQDVVLKPGMPVEIYLMTGARSVMSYLLAPLSSHLRNAFRE